jgi:hypothetical protein
MRKAIGNGIIGEFIAIIFTKAFPCTDPDKTFFVLEDPAHRI